MWKPTRDGRRWAVVAVAGASLVAALAVLARRRAWRGRHERRANPHGGLTGPHDGFANPVGPGFGTTRAVPPVMRAVVRPESRPEEPEVAEAHRG